MDTRPIAVSAKAVAVIRAIRRGPRAPLRLCAGTVLSAGRTDIAVTLGLHGHRGGSGVVPTVGGGSVVVCRAMVLPEP